MKWVKKGLIFRVDENSQHDWMLTHAQIPVADILDDERLRIYFATRDQYNRTSTTYIEVEAGNPSNVLYIHDKAMLSPGKLGTFDDSGAMPSCIVKYQERKYFYFIGWNVGTTVRYRNSIGLAVSDDDGRTFQRLFEGPVMDRTHVEPYFVVTPYVIIEDGIWKMWYCGCTGWCIEKGITEPRYQIKYAESSDGINWTRESVVCIQYKHDKEANTRPYVIKENGIYRMWYCYRSISDYRIDREKSYRIGYAESPDGIKWIRKDDEGGIGRSEEGWDSEMTAYPYLYEYEGKKYMLYNGNGFGKSGFGYAILDEA
jgi:hypothetical protein